MKTKLVKGFTKIEAFEGFEEQYGFDPLFKNATKSWEKAGSPVVGTKEFLQFSEDYLRDKTRLKQGLGAHITVNQGSADTRERPFKVYNEVTEGKRKFKRFYKIIEMSNIEKDSEGNIKSWTEGKVVGKFETKALALQSAKDLTSMDKNSYVCKIEEEVIEGNAIAFCCEYTPAASAKEGQWLAIGVEVQQ